MMPALGIGCEPVIVKGQKEQFLDWLSWGVESEAISNSRLHGFDPLAAFSISKPHPAGEVTLSLWVVTGY